MKELDIPLRPVGSHTGGTSISSATTLTIPNGARYVLVQALAQNVRYTLDGTTPTTTLGFQLKAGDPPRSIWCETGVTLKFIEEAATASLQYQFYN
jgi:hypothetical protein